MTYLRPGRSGIEASAIGLGCMSLGTDRTTGERIIRRALDLGVTLFDTADLYDHGGNEELVGSALRGVRDKVVIATKAGNRWRPGGSGWDWDPTKEYILQEVHASLRRLQTDRIDLYQLHGGTIDDPIDETVEAFERLVQEGSVRAWGISSIRPNVVRRFAAVAGTGAAKISSEMVQEWWRPISRLRSPQRGVRRSRGRMPRGPSRGPAGFSPAGSCRSAPVVRAL